MFISFLLQNENEGYFNVKLVYLLYWICLWAISLSSFIVAWPK